MDIVHVELIASQPENGPHSLVVGSRMLRLIQTKLASSGESDLGNAPPAPVDRLRTLDVLLLQFPDRRLEIITHQIEFVRATLIRWMYR